MAIFSYRNNDISYGGAMGVRGNATLESFELVDAIWCVLMYYFDQIKFEKSTTIY